MENGITVISLEVYRGRWRPASKERKSTRGMDICGPQRDAVRFLQPGKPRHLPHVEADREMCRVSARQNP